MGVLLVFAEGRMPKKEAVVGVETDGLIIYFSTDQKQYAQYDAIHFTVALANTRKEPVTGENILCQHIDPVSTIRIIAFDDKGNRYSGSAGNRIDVDEEHDHNCLIIPPKNSYTINFFQRDLSKTVTAGDKPCSALSDKAGTYTVHAIIDKKLLKTPQDIQTKSVTITVKRM
jgi:hypothetical protein